MPTKFTNTAGLAGIVASVFWIAAAATLLFADAVISDWVGAYFIYFAAVSSASAMTLFATAGLRVRHGGLGTLGLAGLIIAGVGLAASVVISWALPFWMTIQGLGYLLVALAVLPMRVAPRLPVILYGTGLLLGSITFAIARVMEVGSIDEWGDYPLAYEIGGVAGFAFIAAGLLGLGLWLRGEKPAPIDAPPDEALTA